MVTVLMLVHSSARTTFLYWRLAQRWRYLPPLSTHSPTKQDIKLSHIQARTWMDALYEHRFYETVLIHGSELACIFTPLCALGLTSALAVTRV